MPCVLPSNPGSQAGRPAVCFRQSARSVQRTVDRSPRTRPPTPVRHVAARRPSGRRRDAMATILDTLRSLVTPDLLAQASSAFGESQGNVSRGLGAAFPAILAALLSKSNDTGAMRQIMELLADPSIDANLLRNPGGLIGAGGLAKSPIVDLGARCLSALFGPQMGSVASSLATEAGVKPQTASSLLSLAAPLVLAALGARVRRDGLNAAGLADLL